MKGWVKYLKDFILGEQTIVEEGEAIVEVTAEDEKALIARRMWAFDQLLHVARVGGGQKDDEVLAELLEFFAVLGWFEVRKSGKGAVSSSSSRSCRLMVSLLIRVLSIAVLYPCTSVRRIDSNRLPIAVLLDPYRSVSSPVAVSRSRPSGQPHS